MSTNCCQEVLRNCGVGHTVPSVIEWLYVSLPYPGQNEPQRFLLDWRNEFSANIASSGRIEQPLTCALRL